MRRSILIACFIFVGIAAFCDAAHKTKWHQLDKYTFEDYVKEFSKDYSAEEYDYRRHVFEKRLSEIKRHNKQDNSWKKGVNHLSDRNEEELKQLRGYNKALAYATNSKRDAAPVSKKATLPPSVDWRNKGILTAVKDQGECGSCWTFATAESVEAYYALATGNLLDLSEQQVLDCTPNPNQCGGTGGCQGGTTEIAFQQITNIGGLTSEWMYPYVSYFGQNYQCHFNVSNTRPIAKVASYVGLPSNQLQPVLEALSTQGPLAVAVDASAWSEYETGVFNGCNQTNPDIDHAVQLVGYGTDPQYGDYWIIRNSWSPLWGEAGYIRIQKSNTPSCGTDITPQDGVECKGGPATQTVCGTCGVLFDVTYPVIAH